MPRPMICLRKAGCNAAGERAFVAVVPCGAVVNGSVPEGWPATDGQLHVFRIVVSATSTLSYLKGGAFSGVAARQEVGDGSPILRGAILDTFGLSEPSRRTIVDQRYSAAPHNNMVHLNVGRVQKPP